MTPAPQIPTPKLLGRSVRFFLGATLLFFLAQLVLSIPHAQPFLAPRPGWSIPQGNWWMAAIACFLALGTLVNSGFSRKWGVWPQLFFLFLAAAAIAWDRVADASLWAAPLAVLVLLLAAYVLGHAGISYVVSAFAATPG
ncbi:MAG: hypothetical protein KGL59_13450 [Acidobacteriota bacterium]|nr:hypothetical protein [Acidobacteriota bacterium]